MKKIILQLLVYQMTFDLETNVSACSLEKKIPYNPDLFFNLLTKTFLVPSLFFHIPTSLIPCYSQLAGRDFWSEGP
jgi:hypothetical protein